MDPVSLALIIKGLATLGLILGGLFALRYGYRLYAQGMGSVKDSYALELSGLKLRANSVGSILMATAFVWAWAAVAMSPNLSQDGQAVQVYSFHTPEGEITTRTLAVRASAGSADDPEELKALFREAAASADNLVSLRGEAASLDLDSLEASSASTGTWEISAHAESPSQSASLVYEPQVSRGRITFIPAHAEAATDE